MTHAARRPVAFAALFVGLLTCVVTSACGRPRRPPGGRSAPATTTSLGDYLDSPGASESACVPPPRAPHYYPSAAEPGAAAPSAAAPAASAPPDASASPGALAAPEVVATDVAADTLDAFDADAMYLSRCDAWGEFTALPFGSTKLDARRFDGLGRPAGVALFKVRGVDGGAAFACKGFAAPRGCDLFRAPSGGGPSARMGAVGLAADVVVMDGVAYALVLAPVRAGGAATLSLLATTLSNGEKTELGAVGNASGLVAGKGDLFYLQNPGIADFRLMRFVLPGGPPSEVLHGHADAIARGDDGFVYYAENDEVRRVPVTGGASAPVTVDPRGKNTEVTGPSIKGLAVMPTHVYWARAAAQPHRVDILRATKPGPR